MEDPPLYDDSSTRCSRCMDIRKQVEQSESSYRSNATVFGRTPRLYTPTNTCRTCTKDLQYRVYNLGDHLMEAHEDLEVRLTMSIGCCYACLLCLQLKCRNGFKSNNTQPTKSNGKVSPYFYNRYSTTPENSQLFWASVDGLINMAHYLPQEPGSQTEGQQGVAMTIIPLPKIHSGTLKSWLKSCEDNHNCDEQLLTFPRAASTNPRQTFINVKSQSLVTCEVDVRYIALSYVWGGVSQLSLTTSNHDALCQDGSLLAFAKEIPQVIKDAVQFVSNIGETFLWVDSLCIVQDDESLKHHLISQMGSIYNGAVATIIAACGDSAAFGLPGVRENSRVLETSAEIPGTGLHIGERRDLQTILDSSTYYTRGWTFQERLLSRRCFYFTETQVFFECRRIHCSEDRSKWEIRRGDNSRLDQSRSSRLIINKLSASKFGVDDELRFRTYCEIVREYRHKKLTFANDVVDAFAGVAAAMGKLSGWTMVHGLPKKRLDWALLWEPEERQDSTKLSTRNFRQRAEDMDSIPALKKEFHTLEVPSWSWLAWTGDFYYHRWSALDVRAYHTPFELISPSIPPASALTTQSKHKRLSTPSVLSFSSECVCGSSFAIKSTNLYDQKRCCILNSAGQSVGIIPGAEAAFAADYNGDLVDIVLLSASRLSVNRFEERRYPSIFGGLYARENWSILTVMFVKWDNGYAKRIALGYIQRLAWKEAKPKVKPILLA